MNVKVVLDGHSTNAS